MVADLAAGPAEEAAVAVLDEQPGRTEDSQASDAAQPKDHSATRDELRHGDPRASLPDRGRTVQRCRRMSEVPHHHRRKGPPALGRDAVGVPSTVGSAAERWGAFVFTT